MGEQLDISSIDLEVSLICWSRIIPGWFWESKVRLRYYNICRIIKTNNQKLFGIDSLGNNIPLDKLVKP